MLRTSAANIPPGPKPATTGRISALACGTVYSGASYAATFCFLHFASSFSSLSTETATEYSQCISFFCARVERALCYLNILYRPSRELQLARGLDFQPIAALPDIEAQISYQYHLPSLPAVTPLAHAHWRVIASAVGVNVQKLARYERCGTNQLSSVSGFTPVVLMPPAVT